MRDDVIVHRLKLRDLRMLLAVTQAGSMAKAATLLATSQPAVSRAIADMEATLGVALLERSSQGVQPTPYGDALIKRGVAVFDELRQGVKDIDFIADPTAGEVKIGGTSATMTGIISTVISRMSLKYSRVNFQVVTRPPSTLLHELRERNLDMVISMTFDPVTDENIQSEILYEDYLVIVAAPNNPLARRRRVELADLVNEAWAMNETNANTFLAGPLAEAFRAKGLEPPRVAVAGATGRLGDTLLATGRFITTLPESLLHFPIKLTSLKRLPVDLPTTRGKTRIMTLKNRTLSPVAQLFIEFAREVAKPLAKRK